MSKTIDVGYGAKEYGYTLEELYADDGRLENRYMASAKDRSRLVANVQRALGTPTEAAAIRQWREATGREHAQADKLLKEVDR